MASLRAIPFSVFVFLGLTAPGLSQEPGQALAPPRQGTVAATVNGQPIYEGTIDRALKRAPKERQVEARLGILQFLVDNMVIDQYLQKVGIEVANAEMDAKLDEIRAEVKKEKQTFEKLLQGLGVDVREFRAQLLAELRWDKFLAGQASEKNLIDVFQKNPEMFDGTMVRVRHILLTPRGADSQAGEEAKRKLILLKKEIEEETSKAISKSPQSADKLAHEGAALKAREDAFANVARRESACPSKDQGGDVGWFPRLGSMIEPFARAAFGLRPFEMSDIVQTPFGFHLILVIDRKPGKETKFEEVKDIVRDVYAQRLREAMIAQLKPQANIVINAAEKK